MAAIPHVAPLDSLSFAARAEGGQVADRCLLPLDASEALGVIDKTLDRLVLGGVSMERDIVATAGLEGRRLTVRHDTRGREP